MNPIQYFDEALSLFNALPFYHTDQLSLAGRTVQLRTPSLELRDRMLPALGHLVNSDDLNRPELTIWYAEDQHLPQKLKAPPWPGFNAQGFNASLNQDDIQIFFQPWQRQLFLYSRSKQTGIYWAQTLEYVPWWECTFSFRAIFHFWTRDLPAQLVHAGAMSKDGMGVLITGQSGSGKSTSCLNLLEAGYDYLGDDYVWLEIGDRVKVFTLYQTAKIEPHNLEERFAHWKKYIQNKEDYRQQKAIFHINNLFPQAGVCSSNINAILLPKVVHQEHTRFEKANPTHALMNMAPTTLHHLPHHREMAYQKLMSVSASLPSFHWKLGSDKQQFIASFHDFLTHELSYN